MNISDLSTSFSIIRNLVGAAIDERDRQKAAAIQMELTDRILQTQAQLGEVLGTIIEQQGRIAALEQRNRELEADKAEQASYRLTKVGSVGEFFAYQLNPTAEAPQDSGQINHFLCQPCFDAGKKVVLVGNGEGHWQCPSCLHGASTEKEVLACVFTRAGRFDDY